MVRIKVYKLSQVAVVAAAILLVIVLSVVLVNIALGDGGQTAGVSAIWDQAAAQVVAAFAVFDLPEDTLTPLFEDVSDENEHTDEAVEEIIIEIIRESEPTEAPTARPRVLIYHTHTHEAYAQVDSDRYVETETWRTADQTHSVVRVGEALTELLRRHGFEVIHDTTDHEPPKLSTAYSRSLKTLEGYAGEEFDLYIDLHRDAYNSSLAKCAYVNGQPTAQLMVLIGNGGDYEVKPDYEENLRFASRLTEQLNRIAPGICREVMVKNGRYNQHVGTPAILVEVGHNENTLEEALSSMPYLSDALAALMMGK